MYFPYLRGKQFELQALLGVPMAVYAKTLPIIEPVNGSSDKFYLRLAQQGRPFILIMNPQHPQRGRMGMNVVQTTIVDTALASHPVLTLGYIVDQHSSVAELQTFFRSNPTRDKAVILRYTPVPAMLASIAAVVNANTVAHLIFDEKRTSPRIRGAFTHSAHVIITDGFQRQERNADYPSFSAFDSSAHTWRAEGLVGVGDYLTVGDHFQSGGSQPMVVTLHLTIPDPMAIEMHHFSSTMNSTIPGAVGPKFLEAASLLVTSARVLALPSSTGIVMYQDWHSRSHRPQLGAAKQASLQHHIETLARIV